MKTGIAILLPSAHTTTQRFGQINLIHEPRQLVFDQADSRLPPPFLGIEPRLQRNRSGPIAGLIEGLASPRRVKDGCGLFFLSLEFFHHR